MMHTREELKVLQSLSLEEKVLRTQTRIIEWYIRHKGTVYVSFSGGKDSTVLLHLVRKIYPDVPAVFCDTGLEFPEVKKHVKTVDNVTILRPKMTFREVVEKCGWCYPSKGVADSIHYAKKGRPWATNRMDGLNTDGTKNSFQQRCKKWKFLVDSPFRISPECCAVMKKRPMHEYEKQTGRKKYIGIMAAEGAQRETAWLRFGCNSFAGKSPRSAPLSFWTEQDVLEYIKENDLPIPSVYGEIVRGKDGKLRTTGEQRTGCMFCPIGCHLDRSRWIRMRRTHPEIYKYCMETLGLREFLEYVGEQLHIDFFEEQLDLFEEEIV